MAITAADVKALREKTGAGMMECKKALTEANGDAAEAEKILKEKGLNVGNKIWDFREHPEEMPVQIDDSIRHIGQEWDGILFNTTSGKVIYRLCFLQRERDSSQIDTTFKEVKLYLKEKYSVYLTEDTDYNTTYSDEKTEVSLWKTSNTSLRLCYYATTLTEEE